MTSPAASRAFTLVELLVVLALIAMAAALVGPDMYRWIERSEERAWRNALGAHLRGLPVQAYDSGSELTIDADAIRRAVPQLPPTVEIRVPKPMSYYSSGVASGGSMELRINGRPVEVWRVAPLTGQVSAGVEGAG